ncbi:MAG: glycosyltransferase family 4 protein [Candidatus Thorarchaeota archaeon]|jgi:glycosyltransferase involved in cell wall biosynthesis
MKTEKEVRLLAFAGLFDRLLDAHLSSILEANNVRIDVIRSHPGTRNPRVTYHSPPKEIARIFILTILWKILKTIHLSMSGKHDAVFAIYNVPHLYLANLASFISRKPLIYTVIAGPTEYEVNGPLLKKISGMMVRRVNQVIVRMNTTGDYLVDNHGVERKRIVQFPMLNLPAIRHFYPLNAEKTLDLIVVSNLIPDKHIELFIDIISRLEETIPEITGGIVGDGPLRGSLEEYARLKGLSDNITFYGFVSSTEKLNELLNSAQAFVLNSSHEGAPNTIVEAMNAGVFCVASRVGEVPIRITHGYDGFIVDRYDDLDSYVSILQDLLRNPDALRKLQRNAAESKTKLSRKAIRFWRVLIARLAQSKE